MKLVYKSTNFSSLKSGNLYIVILLTVVFIFCFNKNSIGQTIVNSEEKCFDPNIHTILLCMTGNELSIPILKYQQYETLSLDFDYLDEKGDNYSYSIVNCMYDWKINSISDNFYIDGFNDIPINDFRSSINTTRLYTHYSASIPDEELNILSSGNYMLKVYKNGDSDKTAFTKRFCVAEKLIDIKSKIILYDEETQELQLEIDLKNLDLMNPLAEIKIIVIKNYDWNNQVKIKSPAFLREKKLYLDLPFQISSPGGNEFRNFDIKNTRYESENISYIEFRNPYYHIHLKPDKLKQYTPYFTSQDFNSHFYVDANKAYNRHEEADYVYVYFTLESAQPFGSDVYIYGALTGYKTDTSNYMTYNTQKRTYEKTLLLKQGFYDYAYALKDYDKTELDFSITEGNHSETENDYLILVYLRKPVSDIDRLIGYKIVNSIIK